MQIPGDLLVSIRQVHRQEKEQPLHHRKMIPRLCEHQVQIDFASPGSFHVLQLRVPVLEGRSKSKRLLPNKHSKGNTSRLLRRERERLDAGESGTPRVRGLPGNLGPEGQVRADMGWTGEDDLPGRNGRKAPV